MIEVHLDVRCHTCLGRLTGGSSNEPVGEPCLTCKTLDWRDSGDGHGGWPLWVPDPELLEKARARLEKHLKNPLESLNEI